MERQEYVDAALEAGDHAGFYAEFYKPYELKCVYIFQVLGNRQGDAVGSISSKAVVSLSFSPISLPNEFQITSNTTKIELNLHLEFQTCDHFPETRDQGGSLGFPRQSARDV